jgi:hypothetical protein
LTLLPDLRAAALFRDEARHYGMQARRLLFLHDDPEAAATFAFSAEVALRLMRRELGLPRRNVTRDALLAFARARRPVSRPFGLDAADEVVRCDKSVQDLLDNWPPALARR